jgi:hypothetical protein
VALFGVSKAINFVGGGREMMHVKAIGFQSPITGVPYLEFLRTLGSALQTRNYFEIGTNTGDSLRAFGCDSVCVDPNFKVEQNVLGGKRRVHFFQMTSDEFFDHHDLRSFLPSGIDIGFLDGLHHFEVLLRDFINAEKFCHSRSVLLLHDCVPVNDRMAEREFRYVETEDPATRGGWTGDVWRLIPLLARFRPDLRVMLFDCPPTGLVVCTGLDPYSRLLTDKFDQLVDEFSRMSLQDFGIQNLWHAFPTIDTATLAANREDLPGVLFG